jgi:hypothetical protein
MISFRSVLGNMVRRGERYQIFLEPLIQLVSANGMLTSMKKGENFTEPDVIKDCEHTKQGRELTFGAATNSKLRSDSGKLRSERKWRSKIREKFEV